MDRFEQIISIRRQLRDIYKKEQLSRTNNKKQFEEGEGLEGSCWEGYEAIGTKILDGKEVPNCVPIKEDMGKIKKEGFPIPSPNSEEDENIFISRCVSSIIDEYDQNVALGICYSKWNEK